MAGNVSESIYRQRQMRYWHHAFSEIQAGKIMMRQSYTGECGYDVRIIVQCVAQILVECFLSAAHTQR